MRFKARTKLSGKETQVQTSEKDIFFWSEQSLFFKDQDLATVMYNRIGSVRVGRMNLTLNIVKFDYLLSFDCNSFKRIASER